MVLHSCGRSLFLAAFHVPQDDIRVVLKEITHGSTLMLYASYSVVMNMSDFSLFAANPSAQAFGNPNENIMNNITNAITDGLKHMLPARNGSVFSISLDFQTEQRVTSHFSEMVMEGSVVLLALNSSEPNTYIGWSDLAVVAFQSKLPPAIQARNIISPQNFKASFGCLILFCDCCYLRIVVMHVPAPLMRSFCCR